MPHIDSLLLSVLEKNKSTLGGNPPIETVLKMLVEIRESARRNEDFERYERITNGLKSIGIELNEEIRISARVAKG